MLKEHARSLSRLNRILDLCVTLVSFLLAYLIRGRLAWASLEPLLPLLNYQGMFFLIIPVWATSLHLVGAYGSYRAASLRATAWVVVKGVALGLIGIATLSFLLKMQYVSRSLLLIFGAVNLVLLTSSRLVIYGLLKTARRRGLNYRFLLFVGTGQGVKKVIEEVQRHTDWGMRLVGCLEVDPARVSEEVAGVPVIGMLDDLRRILSERVVDEVIVALPLDLLTRGLTLLNVCEEFGVRSRVMADFYTPSIAKLSLDDFQGIPMLSFSTAPLEEGKLLVKRVLDVVVSACGLLLTAPLLGLIVLLIKATSPGPALFRQERCGLNGRRFQLLKFRTMVLNAEALKEEVRAFNEMSGPVFKMRDDPRLTPIGRILRRWSLDELPQLWNVLRGDMSLVGPRPPLPEEVEKYDDWQRRRLSMRPGITCLWQCSGRNTIDFDEWMKMDLEYIDTWSLALDLEILARTVPAVLFGVGAR